jgi:predicted RNA binding protein YcfA (HicA-like mRNA interferase family)
MVQGMKRSQLERQLRHHGCTLASQHGPHDKWRCPCGQHSANIPRHREVSAGVIRDTVRRLACLPEGWWQR